MITLLIDTHMNKVVIVLFKDGKILKKVEQESNQSHSIITMPLLKNILEDENVDIKDLNDILVVNGPGSFTGVRIGVTIAKTMAYCLNLPIRCISSIEVLLSNISNNKKISVAINDKNGYFIGKFDENNTLLDNYFYVNNQEYLLYKEKNDVIDYIDFIDYEAVWNFSRNKEVLNPHKVNPLYVKKIEVQK